MQLFNKRWKQEPEEIKAGIFDPGFNFTTGKIYLGPNLVLINDSTNYNQEARHYYHSPCFLFLPFSFFGGSGNGVSILVKDYGFLYEAMNLFGIRRLQGIRQFTYLPYYREDSHCDLAVLATPINSRFFHTMTATIMMEIWMRFQRYFSEEEINLGILLALLHDAATSSFGDMLKYFHADFDEEQNIERYIQLLDDQQKIIDFCKKYNINLQKVIRIIKGEEPSILWKVFKWFDRISYTAIDYMHIQPESLSEFGSGYCSLKPHPNFADCFLDLKLTSDRQNIVWEFSEKLLWFLFIRILLARNFYFNPECRSIEIYKGLQMKIFYPQFVTVDDLISKTEIQVFDLIEDRLKENPVLFAEFEGFQQLLKNTTFYFIEKTNQQIVGFHKPKKILLLRERCPIHGEKMFYYQKIKFKPGLDIVVRDPYTEKTAVLGDLSHRLIIEIKKNKTKIEQPICYFLR